MKFVFLEQSPNRNQLIVGAGIVLIFSAIGGAIFANDNYQTKVLVARADLPSSVPVSANDFDEVLINGEIGIETLITIPDGKSLKVPLNKGEILQPHNLVATNDDFRTLALALETSNLPSRIDNGIEVDLWVTGETSSTRLLGSAEIVAIATKEYADLSSVSISVNRDLVAPILEAGQDIKIVIP